MAGVEDAFDAGVLRRLYGVAMLPDGLVSEFIDRDNQYCSAPPNASVKLAGSAKSPWRTRTPRCLKSTAFSGFRTLTPI